MLCIGSDILNKKWVAQLNKSSKKHCIASPDTGKNCETQKRWNITCEITMDLMDVTSNSSHPYSVVIT